MEKEILTPVVGQKFDSDGSVLTYPGNSIICFVDRVTHAPVFNLSIWLQEQLKATSWHDKYALLPPSSFHMTVIELLCDQRREPSAWSNRLPLTMDIAETDIFFHSQVSTVPAPSNLRMKYSRLPGSLTHIELEPADNDTCDAIWRYRDAIAEVTGVRFPDHDQYRFHISLAYHLIQLTPEEEAERKALHSRLSEIVQQSDEQFVPDAPQLVFFDDMFQFVTYQERHTLVTR